MELEIAMTYAQALFGAAKDLDRIDEIKDEINGINDIFSKEKSFYELMTNPALPTEKKKKILAAVFDGRVSTEVMSFMYILLDKGRFFYFGKIVSEYKKLKDNYYGVGKGVIYSVMPLSDDQMKKFEKDASDLLHKNVRLRNEIDTNLIGGVKLLVDGKLIDASLRSRLDDLRRRIQEV